MSKLSQYTYPFSYVLATSDTWTKHGLSTEAYLSLAGVDTGKLAEPNATINGEELKRLNTLGRKLNASGTPISILVAEQLGFTNVGLLGLAVTASRTLREALLLLRDYHALSMPGLSIRVIEDETTFTLEYDFDPEFGEILPFLNEVLVCCMRRFSHLFEEAPFPLGVYFSHQPEFPLSVYEAFVNGPVYAREDHNFESSRVVFRLSDLEAKLKYSDTSTLNVIRQQLAAALENNNKALSWEKKVEQLWQAHALRQHFLTQKEMADLLNMSPRTLVRKLTDEGLQYRNMTQRWRLEIAKKLLKQTSTSVGDIATQVGFDDETAFFRFFKEAEGVTPRKFRIS